MAASSCSSTWFMIALRLKFATKRGQGPVLDGFDGAGFLVRDGHVAVRVEHIPHTEKGQTLPAPLVVTDGAVAPRDGAVELTIPWQNERDAYSVLLGDAAQAADGSAGSGPRHVTGRA